MKFHNPILNFERTDGRTDGRMDGHSDGQTDKPKAICPIFFFKVGDIKTIQTE